MSECDLFEALPMYADERERLGRSAAQEKSR